MENSKKLSLQNEIEQDVQRIEEEIANHPELENIQVTKEMDDALFAKIQEYEKTKTQDSPKPSNVVSVKRKRKKVRWAAAVAAVLVLVCGLSITSVGSKSYWKELLSVLVGDGSAKMIDVEEMEKQMTEDIDEMQVYKELDEKIGTDIVWIRYKPKGMGLERYEFDEALQQASLLYNYGGEIILYSVYAGKDDSSWTVKQEDTIIESYTKTVNGVEITVEEQEKPEETGIRRVARFEFKGIHYELNGVMEKEELEKILENLYFL